MTTVAELLIESLADYGVKTVWGVVGDALNPVTDAIRREDRIEWIGVRHEEAGAFAASAQAQLTGRLAVCMGTVGPGAIHLLNGLYDAKKSHAPVLAICGQVPREEIGSDFFQEVDNDVLFADVAVFSETVTSVDQLPELIEQAGNAALQERGVAVLTLPGDVGGLDLPKGTPVPRFVDRPARRARPRRTSVAAGRRRCSTQAEQGDAAGRRRARATPATRCSQLAERLSAPMVLTLKAQGGTRARQRLRGRPVRPARQPRDREGVRGLRRAVHGRHRLPLPGVPPAREDRDPARRPRLAHRSAYAGRPSRWSATRRLALQALLPLLEQKTDREPPRRGALDVRRRGASGRQQFTDPAYDAQAEGPAAPQGRQPRRTGSVPSCSPRPSTGTPPPTRSSPPTPAWRPSGCRGSSG